MLRGVNKMKQFGGKVLFLDKSDISISDILPAKCLAETDKHAYKQFLFEDLNLADFDPKTDIAGKRLIITRDGFGCGNNCEQTAWAFEANGIYAIVATNFAKSFRQSMLQNNLLTIELEHKLIDDIFRTFGDKETDGSIILNEDGTAKVKLISGSLSKSYHFRLGEFDKELLENNNWIGYSEKKK